jgi:hypothetical protein
MRWRDREIDIAGHGVHPTTHNAAMLGDSIIPIAISINQRDTVARRYTTWECSHQSNSKIADQNWYAAALASHFAPPPPLTTEQQM